MMSKEIRRRVLREEPDGEAVGEAVSGGTPEGAGVEDDGDEVHEHGVRAGIGPVPRSQAQLPESWAEAVARKAEAWQKEKEAREEREKSWR
jgi:hypothetical protein